ncbi:MAG: AP2 domain-containing protein [Verrucomicrobiota bacterium]
MKKPRPNYGISRIDQPEKKNHGFYVRITHKGKTTQKFFPDKSLGGKAKALKAAQAFRDSLVAKLPKTKQEAASRPKRKVLKSGVVGVTHVVSRAKGRNEYAYWQAAWNDSRGRRRTAKFSISRYGKKKALDMAIKARKAAVKGGGKKKKTAKKKSRR